MVELEVKNLNIEDIAGSGQCFRWILRPDGTCRIIAGDKILYIKYGSDKDKMILDCSKEEFELYWKDYLDLNTDYGRILRHVPKGDDFLKRASEFGRGIRILNQDPWEMIVSFIISQRKNIPAIMSCIEKISEKAGKCIGSEEGKKLYAFPTPKELSKLSLTQLNECSLGYRSKYIFEAARLFTEKPYIIEEMKKADDDELFEMLLDIYGIGKKVAYCVMLFGFHRLDAFPMDVWMNRIEEKYYPDGIPVKDYSPYGGIYQQYMFAYERHLNGVGQSAK
ncbi:MAG TPA: 8-oxoguanine DNA glycosylase [Lachnospiraceae bacterium]|nr:8-oxoguanine DNA glycosylase [Lachnospiraceae bacterium]